MCAEQCTPTDFDTLRARLEALLQNAGGEPQPDLLELVERLRRRHAELEAQNEELLRGPQEAESHFKLLFQFAPLPYQSLDEDGLLRDVNEAWLTQLGYRRQEAIGTPFEDVVDPSERRRFRHAFEQFKAAGIAHSVVMRLRRSDGSPLTVEFHGRVHRKESAPFRTHCVFQDITERLEAAEEREIMLRLLRASNDMSRTRDLMRTVVDLLHGWSGCEAVGIRLRDGDDFPYCEIRGFPPEFVQAESRLCETDERGCTVCDEAGLPVLDCMCGNVIRGRFDPDLPFFTSGGSFWTNSTSELLASRSEEDRQSRTRNRCHGEGYESVALVPLKTAGETLGLLQFNDRRRGMFSPRRIALFERLAGSLAAMLAHRRAAGRLRDSETRFRTLVDQAGDALFVHDMDGRITDVNRAAIERYGYTREELLALSVPDIDPDTAERGDKAKFWRQVEACPMCFESRHRRKDGSMLSVEITVTAVTLRGKRQLLALAHDITARKEIENLLLVSEANTRALLDATDSGMALLDVDGRMLAVNRRVAEVFGRDEALLLGRSAFDFLPAEVAEQRRARLRQAVAQRRVVRFEDRRGGAIIDNTIRPIADAEGKVYRVAVFGRDVTAERQVQAALIESEDRFRALVEHAPVSILALRDGRYLFGNPAAARLLGYAHPSELAGLDALSTIAPECRAEIAGRMAAADAGRFNAPTELKLLRKDGTTVWSESVSVRFGLPDGPATLIVGQDVSERKRAQDELKMSEGALRGFFESCQAGLGILDAELRYVRVNEALAQSNGIPREAHIGKTLEDVLGPAAERVAPHLRRVLETGEPVVGQPLRGELRADPGEVHHAIFTAFPLPAAGEGAGLVGVSIVDTTALHRAQDELQRIAWLLTDAGGQDREIPASLHDQPESGAGEVLRAVGAGTLESLASGFLSLLGTSTAVYEADGSYALGLFASGWCRTLDRASRRQCAAAPDSGGAPVCNLCHESCWTDVTKPAIEQGRPVDAPCRGGLRIYAIPIRAGNEVVGALNFGYGDPPRDPARIAALARRFGVDPAELRRDAEAYESRPRFIVETAKARLHHAALLIGTIVERARAEAALRRERDRAQQYLDIAAVLFVVLDAQGRIGRINQKALELLGYEERELLGADWFAVCLPEHNRASVRAVFHDLMRGRIENAEHVVSEVVTRDGETRLIAWHNALVRDGEGKIVGTLSSGEDVTARREAQVALSRSRANLAALIENIDGSIWSVDRDFRLLVANTVFHDDIAAWRGRRFATGELLLPENAAGDAIEEWRGYYRRALRGERFRVEAHKRFGDPTRCVEYSFNPIPADDGSVAGVTVFGRDVTEERQAQERLIESERRYREIAASLPGAVYQFVREPDGRLRTQFISAGAEQIFELTCAELLDESRMFDNVYPDDLDTLNRSIAASADSLSTWKCEFRIVMPDSGIKWLQGVSNPHRRPDGGVVWNGVLLDVTERHRFEEQAAEHREQLQRADKLATLGVLVSGVAHEINNPNQFILSNIDLLERSWNTIRMILDTYREAAGGFAVAGMDYSRFRESFPEMVARIRRGSLRIRDIVRELRDYSRSEPVVMDEEVDVNAVINSACMLTSSMLRRTTDRFSVELSGRLPRIRGNYRRLEQVLVNLLINACQAIPDSSCAVAVRSYYDSDRGTVVLEVADEGCGIEPEDLQRVTTPFFTTKRGQGGTGLGLSISAAIVAEHRGSLELESELERGTTVRVCLPRPGEGSQPSAGNPR